MSQAGLPAYKQRHEKVWQASTLPASRTQLSEPTVHFCGVEDKRGQMSGAPSLGLASDICSFKMAFYFGSPLHHARNRMSGVPSEVDEVECHVGKEVPWGQ